MSKIKDIRAPYPMALYRQIRFWERLGWHCLSVTSLVRQDFHAARLAK